MFYSYQNLVKVSTQGQGHIQGHPRSFSTKIYSSTNNMRWRHKLVIWININRCLKCKHRFYILGHVEPLGAKMLKFNCQFFAFPINPFPVYFVGDKLMCSKPLKLIVHFVCIGLVNTFLTSLFWCSSLSHERNQCINRDRTKSILLWWFTDCL